MDSIKVAHVIGSCQSAGAEIFIRELFKEFSKTESLSLELWVMSSVFDVYTEPTINQIAFEKEYIALCESLHIPIKFMGKRPKKNRIKIIRKLREFYDSFQPNIIHSHLEIVSFHTVFALRKKPVIFIQTIHNSRSDFPYLFKYFMNNKVIKYIAISKKIKSLIEQNYHTKPNQVELIQCGINMGHFQYCPNLSETVNQVISVGRFVKEKNHYLLINAYELVYQKLQEQTPVLKIFVTGPLKDEIQQLIIDKNLLSVIKIMGISREIPLHLNQSQIYVMSSLTEGLSISLLEAVSSGVACLATDVGSNDEIIKNQVNGVLVESDNVQQFADELIRLISDASFRHQLQRNSEQSVTQFCIKKSSQKHLKLYETLLKTHQ